MQEEVDNVRARLKAEQRTKDKRATDLLRTMANQEKRRAPFPVTTSDGHKTKHGGQYNHLGRFCWMAVIGPVPAQCEVVDNLPPAVKIITWSAPDQAGQRRIWLVYKTLVHWQTVRKTLYGLDLDVDYVNGCKFKEVKEALVVNGINKIVGTGL